MREVSNLSILECKSIVDENDAISIFVSNLSILECKPFGLHTSHALSSTFLIYPYWNVNSIDYFKMMFPLFVSNLSILECKRTKKYEKVKEIAGF